MEKFVKDIVTPYWWVSVVVIGIIINILSSFFFKRYEQYASKYSEKKRKELEDKETIRQEKIARLVGKKEEQTIYYLNTIYNKQSALEYFLLGVIIINIPLVFEMFYVPLLNVISGSIAFLFVWEGLRLRRQSKYEHDILKEAMSR